MPFCPFCFRVPLLKLSIRKKGTLIIKGLLRNLGVIFCFRIVILTRAHGQVALGFGRGFWGSGLRIFSGSPLARCWHKLCQPEASTRA